MPRLRLVVDNAPGAGNAGSVGPAPDTSRWPARLTDSAPLAAAVRANPQMLAAVVVGFLMVAGLLALRLAQGSPAADTWEGLQQQSAQSGTVQSGPAAPAADPAPGDVVVTVEQGDSLWSIAKTVAPDSDPRPIVAALLVSNGGDSVRIGQQIVIPRQLLD